MATFKNQTFRRAQVQATAAYRGHIIDFVCYEKKIIIELDGGQHTLPVEMQNDSRRDQWFEAQRYKVLRFWDNEVLTNT